MFPCSASLMKDTTAMRNAPPSNNTPHILGLNSFTRGLNSVRMGLNSVRSEMGYTHGFIVLFICEKKYPTCRTGHQSTELNGGDVERNEKYKSGNIVHNVTWMELPQLGWS